jgi:plasmid maintenance system antidote protein VapI
LRQIIEESEMSRNQICLAADIDPSHLHRFVHGTGRLTNDTIDRLADALSLRLVADN